MAQADDEHWIDALAGRDSAAVNADAREASALRAAIRATHDESEAASHDVEMGAQRLQFRLRREGLLSAARPKWFNAAALALAACLVLAVGIVALQPPAVDDVPVYRGAGAQRLNVDDPRARGEILQRELQAMDIKAKVTRFGDTVTINAPWPDKPDARHAAFLKRHGLSRPAGATLTIEIVVSK